MANAKNALLDQQVILVTGAAQGIGAEVAVQLAAVGAIVVLLDKQIPLLEQVYDRITDAGGATPAIYPLDMQGATLADYQQLVASIETTFGRLDGLIHCAATLGQLAPIVNQDPKTWLTTMHVNLTACYLITQTCLPLLQQQPQATIIFTTDSHKNTAYWGAYGISKAAIESLSLQLSDELEYQGTVQVHTLDPGKVNTMLYRRAFPAADPNLVTSAEVAATAYIELLTTSAQK